MSSLKEQLSRIVVSNVKMSNGKTIEQNLKSEAKRLLDCIQKRIDEYYSSYKPKYYDRTFDFLNSMFIAEDILNIIVKDNTMAVSIKFDESLAYHTSLFGGNKVYIPLLINDGWCWDGWENREEDHFHKYNGFHFLEKGIADFNKNNTFKLKIILSKTWKGEKYKVLTNK